MLLQIASNATEAVAEAAKESTSFLPSKDEFIKLAWSIGGKLLVAILILIIGLWIAGRLSKLFVRFMQARKVDETLIPFLKGFVGGALKVLVIIIVISTMGVEMTSIIAVLGSVGLAIGLAIQGSLANAAGGVMLLLLKPFKKGDVVEAQGKTGVIEAINIISTTMKTLDNKVVHIPNGPLASGPITNFTQEDIRRVDIVFGIGYDDDFKKARNIILDVINKHPLTLQEPKAPFVRMVELADSSVNLVTRTWTKTSDYWDLYFDIMETVKAEFDANDITIPYPQRDVHMHQVPN